jgi:hypothetical protein
MEPYKKEILERYENIYRELEMRNRDKLNLAIVAANNHYARFVPITETHLGNFYLTEVTWNYSRLYQLTK